MENKHTETYEDKVWTLERDIDCFEEYEDLVSCFDRLKWLDESTEIRLFNKIDSKINQLFPITDMQSISNITHNCQAVTIKSIMDVVQSEDVTYGQLVECYSYVGRFDEGTQYFLMQEIDAVMDSKYPIVFDEE